MITSALMSSHFFEARFWGKVECSLEGWHLELDLGELVGGLADFAQEGQPARVGVDLVEQVFCYDFVESRVLGCDCLVEPLERLVGIAAKRINVRDVI